MKKANDVTDEMTQQEYSNNKYYVLTFRYIDLLFSYNIKIKVDEYVKLNCLKWIYKVNIFI